jgi:hypothetical protein
MTHDYNTASGVALALREEFSMRAYVWLAGFLLLLALLAWPRSVYACPS